MQQEVPSEDNIENSRLTLATIFESRDWMNVVAQKKCCFNK